MSGDRPPGRRLRMLPVLLLVLLAAEWLTLAQGLRHRWFPSLWSSSILTTQLVTSALFGLAVLALARCRLAPRTAALVVLAAGLLLNLAALQTGPTTSDDDNRYVWDAKVQLAGIDPYRYPPSAPELDRLRGDRLFYNGPASCVWKIPDGRCSKVNRPDVHTIYPPVAEGAFVLARLGSGGGTDRPFPLQVLAVLGVMALSGLLARRALAQRRPVWTVAVWAWCPVTLVELANNAHIDWLAALTSVAALIAYRHGKSGLAGGLLGAAIATKLYPGLLLAAMLRRHPIRVTLSAAGLVVLSYLPHVLAVGSAVIGYLPGYLKEEDYVNGGRFLLLAAVAPKPALTALAAAILLAAALWVARNSDPDAPEQFGVMLVGLSMLVATPSYSWYAVLLLALVAMTGRVEWLPLVIAPTVASLGAAHFGNGVDYRTSCYALALLGVLIGLTIRRARTGWTGRTGRTGATGRRVRPSSG